MSRFKALPFLFILLPALSSAQGFVSGYSASSSNSSLTAQDGSPAAISGRVADGANTAVTVDNLTTLANSSARLLGIKNGGSLKASFGIDGTLYAPTLKTFGATTLSLTSTIADGSGNIGFTLDTTNSLANAGARLISFKNGGTQKATMGTDGTLFIPGVTTFGATTLTLYSNVADGASAVGVTIDTGNAIANSSAKLLDVKNGGVSKFFVDKDGSLKPTTALGPNLGAPGNRWGKVYAFSFNDGSDIVRFQYAGNGSNTYTSAQTDGATAVGHKFNLTNALTTDGAKLAIFYSDGGSTEKFSIDLRGGARMSAATLPTCSSSNERLELWDSGAGGTNTGARSRKCLCTSDGAASPAYAWQNAVSGTVGTSTTCSN